ncbi:MAG: integrin alpha [Planctomycetota bacterium]
MIAPSSDIQANALFGAAIVTADIDQDGYLDVVVGAPGQNVGGRTAHGRVYIFFGPWTPPPFSFDPYTAKTVLDVPPGDGDPDQPTHGDLFGASLAVAPG